MEFDDDLASPGGRPASRADRGPRLSGNRFRDDPQARRPDPAFAQVRAYWEALRAGGPIPKRSQINPRGLETALDRAFMLERVAPGVARVRLAGSHATALMGMEVRGMPLSSLITPDSRDALAEALRAVFDGPAIAEITLDARRSLGRPPLAGRMLILPLRGEDGQTDRAIGCLAAEGTIGRTPRRFDIIRTRLSTVDAVTAGAPAGALAADVPGGGAGTAPAPVAAPVAAPVTIMPAGFSEPRPGFDAAPHAAPRPAVRGRPHLRLVKTDRDG